MSELAQQLIEENLRTKKPVLDLGKCGLQGNEDELFRQLTDTSHLETLILSNDWLVNDLSTLTEKRQTSKNHGPLNNLLQVPHDLPRSLRHLWLNGRGAYLESILPVNEDDYEYEEDYPAWQPTSLKNLELIGELPLLESLYLAHVMGGGFTSLAFLSKLSHLRYLNLCNNNLTSIEDVKKLSWLTYLNIAHHRLTHLDDLQGFDQLRGLIASHGSLRNLQAVTGMPNLEKLIVSENALENFDLLGLLQQLQVLDVGGNQGWNLNPLLNLKKLRKLDVYNLPLRSAHYSQLKKMDALEHLKMGGSQSLKSFAFLKDMKKLKSLDISGSRLQSFHFAKYIQHLHHLDISYNQFKHLTIEDFPQLKTLTLEGNDLRTLSVKNLPDLTSLGFWHKGVYKKLKKIYLDHLPKLTTLHLEDVQELRNCI